MIVCSTSSPFDFMSANAGRQRPAIGTFDDGFEGLGPSRELLIARSFRNENFLFAYQVLIKAASI